MMTHDEVDDEAVRQVSAHQRIGCSHMRVSRELSLDGAPDAYRHLDNRDAGWTKVLLHR